MIMEIRKRNLGIDVLRILSMQMIVAIHILGMGGILDSVKYLDSQYIVAWVLRISVFCSVDIFILISGYVGFSSSSKPSRIISLWLQILFYSILLTCIFSVLYHNELNYASVLNIFFPITRNQYWFMTSYFGMSLFLPLLKTIMNNTSENLLKICVSLMMICMVCLPIILNNNDDPYKLNNGYSVLWFLLCYLIGACIAKYKWMKLKHRGLYILIFFITVGLNLASKIIILRIKLQSSSNMVIDDNIFIWFNSPSMLIQAICLLQFFSDKKVKSKMANGLEKIAPLTLGVYLFHCHPMVAKYAIIGRFSWIANENPILIVLLVIVISIFIFIIGIGIDKLRMLLFTLLNINNKLILIDILFDRYIGQDKNYKAT